MTPKKCPKCGVWIKHATNFTRHVKHCGEKKYPCPDCKKLFSRKDALRRHSQKAHPRRKSTKEFVCKECQKPFLYESTLRLHEKTCGKPKTKPFHCCFPGCGKSFASKSNFKHHTEYAHQVGGNAKRKREEEEESPRKKPKLPDVVKQVYKADKEVLTLKGLKVDTFFYPKTETQRMDQQVFFKETLPRLKLYLEKVLKEKTGIKWNLMYHCSLSMPDKYRDVPLKHSPYIRTPYPMTTTHPEQLLEQLNMAMEMVEERMTTFMQAGSGWVLEENHALVLEMIEYAPIGGSSYLELPVDISHTKAVINIQYEDQQCFMWSILSALFPALKDAQRISKYQDYTQELNFSGMNFPITIDQISKFETLNPMISVTVIGCEEKPSKKGKKSHLFPLRVPDVKKENHVTLLYWGKGTKYHYAWVKNLNRLLYSTKSHKCQTYFCERCFQGFIRQDLLENHAENCQSIPIQAVSLVKEKISFKAWSKTEETLFRVYADFECILQECKEEECPGKTTQVQQHVPCSMAWVLVSDHPEVKSRSMLFRPSSTTEYSTEELSDQVIDTLMTSLQALEKELLPYQEEVKPMDLSAEEEAQFQASTHCYMCQETFQPELNNLKKVRDHNHATGEYRGAAHSICNLNKRRSKHIPVFFHNLRGYDAHLIMRGIHRHAGKKQIKVIPNNMEKYVSFQLGSLRFLDSLQFLGPGASLEALTGNLTEFPHLYEHMPNVWSLNNPDQVQLLSQKGVYPYSYIKNFQVFEERSLPPKEAFYNELLEEDISDEKYQYAEKVWSTFQCEHLGDYHDLYLYTDIFLLADIFEAFRQVCLKQYSLDPAHYYTVPGFAWDAALKYTQVELDTIHDIDIYQFLERGIRGGISMISHRYAEANNSHLTHYNSEKPNTFITYQDANNLYGHAMVQSLPISHFKWLSDRDIQAFNVMSIHDEADMGYILEVDLEYPATLHDLHSDYPLAPEKMVITHDMLAPYQQQLKEDLGYKPAKVEKLVPNLWNKTKYIIHYRNLKQALTLGMRLQKIHRVLQFKQQPWLKPYIHLNTDLRMKAKSEFEKDFFKLMNNSVLGKTMEDVRKRVNIKLITNPKVFKKHVAKITYKRSEVFVNDEDKEEYLVGLEAKRLTVKLDKPIYTGFTVLELSKHHMYDFHYNHMMKKYGSDNAQLLFTDTDSLTYQVKTKDLYEDMKRDEDLYDTSNYPKDHPLFSAKNKKVIGKFKDETAGLPITEWVGLRPKMYSMKLSDGKEKKTGKGIKKNVLKKNIKHQHFKECLFLQKEYQHSMMYFRSQGHQLFTTRQMKKSLSPFDDKRYILENGTTTRAHGHWRNGVSRP